MHWQCNGNRHGKLNEISENNDRSANLDNCKWKYHLNIWIDINIYDHKTLL